MSELENKTKSEEEKEEREEVAKSQKQSKLCGHLWRFSKSWNFSHFQIQFITDCFMSKLTELKDRAPK